MVWIQILDDEYCGSIGAAGLWRTVETMWVQWSTIVGRGRGLLPPPTAGGRKAIVYFTRRNTRSTDMGMGVSDNGDEVFEKCRKSQRQGQYGSGCHFLFVSVLCLLGHQTDLVVQIMLKMNFLHLILTITLCFRCPS
jgi:hypothetical protein